MCWYLVQTKPNAHLIASKNLRQQNYEVFLPMILQTSKTTRKFVSRAVPLFPGYLFVKINNTKIKWTSINATRGVSRAVTLDGKYRPINHQIIEGLKCRCDNKEFILPYSGINPGDKVRIEQGPFSNFICEVENIEDNQRLSVLIDFMNQKTLTQVSLKNVLKIT